MLCVSNFRFHRNGKPTAVCVSVARIIVTYTQERARAFELSCNVRCNKVQLWVWCAIYGLISGVSPQKDRDNRQREIIIPADSRCGRVKMAPQYIICLRCIASLARSFILSFWCLFCAKETVRLRCWEVIAPSYSEITTEAVVENQQKQRRMKALIINTHGWCPKWRSWKSERPNCCSTLDKWKPYSDGFFVIDPVRIRSWLFVRWHVRRNRRGVRFPATKSLAVVGDLKIKKFSGWIEFSIKS